MANKDFSALRLKKENIAVFQDLKLAYESRNFSRLSNDEFFAVLTDRALTSDLELSADYDRVVRQRYPAADPAGASESYDSQDTDDMPVNIADGDLSDTRESVSESE